MKEDKSVHSPELDKIQQSPGALLRQAREARGQTHVAVGEALHLTGQYIKALENDDYTKLPGLVFVKGYIRSYAAYLKLDVNAVLACYDRHAATLPQIKSHTLAGNYTRKRNDQAIGWAIAATLVIVIALGAGWWFVGREQSAANSSSAAPKTLPAAAGLANKGVAQLASSVASVASQLGIAPDQAVATTAAGINPVVNTIVSPTLPTADVVSSATTILPAQEGVANGGVIVASQQPASEQTANVAANNSVPANSGALNVGVASVGDATNNPSGATVSPAGGRQVNLLREGQDQLQLTFAGNSWVEIDDGQQVRLYGEMLKTGDVLNLQGQAPFHVLLGDGRNVSVSFNASAIDISSSIRDDKTARLTLANPAAQTAELSPTATSSVGVQQ
jgi:cytoskeleton protein RodZ